MMNDNKVVVVITENELELLLQILTDAVVNEGVELLENWNDITVKHYVTDIERIRYLGNEYLERPSVKDEADGSIK